MLLFTLIKKEITQFFRNKTDVLTMFVFPIILILVMGTSLNGLMNVDKNIFENKYVYYKVNDLANNQKYLQAFYNFKNSCEESIKIKFKEIEDDNKARELVNKGKSLAFININKDNYDYYRSENKETSAQKIFKNVFNEYLKRYALIDSIGNTNPKIIQDILKEESLIKLKEEGINSSGIDSFTYYTFAELILIILYVSTITSI